HHSFRHRLPFPVLTQETNQRFKNRQRHVGKADATFVASLARRTIARASSQLDVSRSDRWEWMRTRGLCGKCALCSRMHKPLERARLCGRWLFEGVLAQAHVELGA